MAANQSSKMFQNALCFLPKAENDEKAAGKPDHGKPNSELPSILNFGRSGRWSGSGRRQQEQVLSQGQHVQAWENGLEQHLQEGQHAPRRSSFSLFADQIQSVSQRFAHSINFLHSSSRREDPHNIRTIATEDGNGDGDGDIGDAFETVAVPSRNKLQAPSELIKLGLTTRRSADGDGDVKGDLGSPVDPVTVGKKKLPAASAYMKLITRRSDEKQHQQFDQVQSALMSSRSPESSYRLNGADEKNLALMLAPVPGPDDDDEDDEDFRSDLQIKPQQQQKRQQENRSLGFLENSSASDEECNILQESNLTYKSPQIPGPESTGVQSKSASPQETVLESNWAYSIQSNNGAPRVDEEKENANKHISQVPQWSDLHPIKTTKEIQKPQEDMEINGGQSFEFWNGNSIEPHSGGTEDEGQRPWNLHPIQATRALQPKKFGLTNHNRTLTTAKENENAQEEVAGEGEGEYEGVPPFRFGRTSPNPEYGGGQEQGGDPWALGSWSPGSRHTVSDTQLRSGLGEGFYTPRLSLDASEVGARLAILVDDVPPAAEHAPPASEQVHPLAPADAAVTFTVRSPRRKVRFSTDGDDDLTAF